MIQVQLSADWAGWGRVRQPRYAGKVRAMAGARLALARIVHSLQ